MVRILYRNIALFLVTARTPFAVACSQTCFEPGGSLDPNALDDPELFLSRAYQNSIVVGDYLYIDGGERGYTPNESATVVPDLYMYSVDLSVGWTNQTVSFNRIEKAGIPLLNTANLWKDPSNSSFYLYNGEMSHKSNGVPPPVNQLWRFTVSGNSGTWSSPGVSPAAASDFAALLRVTRAASAFGNGVGYALGGYQYWRTSTAAPFYKDGGIDRIGMPVAGMVAFDMASRSWSNATNASFIESGSFINGGLQYLAGYGADGLLVPLGGQTSVATDVDVGSSTIDNFSTLYMYDIASGTWHAQKTSGEHPPGRVTFCSVSLSGDNGTFEIFIFGGGFSEAILSERDVELDAVYVLSLPAFHWQKSTYRPTQARRWHTCNILERANRQMAVIGGWDITAANLTTWRDPWAQGIGIFDLTAMTWKDHYDPSAGSYTTPQGLKDWYNQNGQSPSEWDDPAVQAWFTGIANSTNPPDDADVPRGANTTETYAPSSKTRDIVGGAVGGSVGVLILAALIWYFLRRRRTPSRAAWKEEGYTKPELGSEPTPIRASELPEHEPSSIRDAAELAHSREYELA